MSAPIKRGPLRPLGGQQANGEMPNEPEPAGMTPNAPQVAMPPPKEPKECEIQNGVDEPIPSTSRDGSGGTEQSITRSYRKSEYVPFLAAGDKATTREEMMLQCEPSDITFLVEGSVFHAHKDLLSKRCIYFQTMFHSGFRESNCREIRLKIPKTVFSSLLDYWYTGDITISIDDVHEFLSVADMMDMDDVKHYCAALIDVQGISPETAIQYLLFGKLYNCKKLVFRSKEVVREKFKDVCQQVDFLELHLDDLIDIINDEYIKIEREEVVCEALLNWICYKEERVEGMILPLKCIRVSQLVPGYLQGILDNQEFAASRGVREFVGNVLEAMENNSPLPPECVQQPLRYYGSRSCIFTCSDQIYIYKKGWEDIKVSTKLSPPRLGAACAMNHLIIVSGIGNHNRSTEFYDPSDDTWQIVDDLRVARIGHMMISVGMDTVYCIGGYDKDNSERIYPITEIEELSIPRGSWEIVGSLKFGVINGAAGYYKESLYIFGTVDEEQFLAAANRPVPPVNIRHPPTLTVHPERACMIQDFNTITKQVTIVKLFLPTKYWMSLKHCQLMDYCDTFIVLSKDASFVLQKDDLAGAARFDNLADAYTCLFDGDHSPRRILVRGGVKMDKFRAHLLGNSIYIFGGMMFLRERNSIFESQCYKMREVKVTDLLEGDEEQFHWSVPALMSGSARHNYSVVVSQLPDKALQRIIDDKIKPEMGFPDCVY